MDISLIARIFPRPPTQLAKFPYVSYAKPSNKVCIILGLLIACHQLVPRVLSYSSPGWRDDPENEDSLFRDKPSFFWRRGGLENFPMQTFFCKCVSVFLQTFFFFLMGSCLRTIYFSVYSPCKQFISEFSN